ncbi:MAG: single-stranded DNA-binding protein [Gaiellaceae bacterium]
MNSVTLIGNLASDVEMKELADEKSVASFLLAVDRTPAEGADFVRISAWNKQGELCARFLAKGRRVAVSGRLRSRSWEEAGKRRSALEVVADRVEFLSRPGRAGAEEGERAAVAV